MRTEEYHKAYNLEKTYWWFVGRRIILRAILEKYLPKQTHFRILDYGCGSGGNFALLHEFGSVTGADASETAAELSSLEYPDVPVFLVTDQKKLPFQKTSFQLITLLDVLEHIENDQEFLQILTQYLTCDGWLLVTVPAYQFLWSEHDIALNHFRRYTLSILEKRLDDADLRVVYATYAISFVLPIIILYRLIKKMKKIIINKKRSLPATSYVVLPKILNNLLILSLKIEAWIISRSKFPLGTSIIVLAQCRSDKKSLFV